MTNYLQSFIESTMGQKLLSAVGVSEPVQLERFDLSSSSFLQGNVLLGAASGGELLGSVCDALKSSESTFYYSGDSSNRLAMEKIFQKAEVNAAPFQMEVARDLRFKALVLDVSGLTCSEDLRGLYEFFHPIMRQLAPCARLLVLARPVEEAAEPRTATARRALEGFTRCLAKEVGKKGATVQLVYVADGAENQLDAPLQFLLSPKSAYVSAQLVHVSPAEKTIVDDWKQPLAGKIALVTGASRGIGEQISETLARDGATVVGLDIPALKDELDSVMRRINGKALAIDVTSEEAPLKIAQWLLDECGGLDVLVHNAGVTRDKTLAGMPAHFWNQVIDINLSAQERINEELLDKKVLKAGGRIICVSSVSGIAGNFGQTNYGASKAGVIGMVNSMAPILKEREITINAVAPGFIATQMTEAMPLMVKEVAKRINALGQAGKPEDVAEVIAFYANPGSNGITGNLIRVCGQSMLGA